MVDAMASAPVGARLPWRGLAMAATVLAQCAMAGGAAYVADYEPIQSGSGFIGVTGAVDR